MLGKLLQGHYQIVQVLGAGGFCQTYLAHDLNKIGTVACVIKHLKPASNHPEALSTLRHLFTREAQALKKLGEYEQVPQLLDHFEEDNEFYLVQEFIEGHPISVELQPGQRWSQGQVLQLLQEVLSILVFVHSHGLIHRDIKPSNLIRRKQDNRLVLIDFGSVKQAWTQVVTSQGQTSASLALGVPATIAIGTPGYMPTEQGRGRPRPNSDIYALGMICIQALTGLVPTQILEDSETGELLWKDHVDSGVLTSVISKMVHYHFKDRYQSATEVLQALQPLLKTGEVEKSVQASSTPQHASSLLPKENEFSALRLASPSKSTLLIGIGTGVTAALVLTVGSYYLFRSSAPNSERQYQVQNANTAVKNITLSKTLTGHTDVVWSVTTSPDGQYLASGSGDSTIKIWNLSNGQLANTLAGHSDQVLSVAISPNGQLASSSWDSTIKLWNLRTGSHRTLTNYAKEVWSLVADSSGQTLASSSGNTSQIWDLRTEKLKNSLTGHSDTVWSLALSPSGQNLATGSKDSTIKIWNLSNGELKSTLVGHSDRVRSVAISPDGQLLASGSWDATIKLWNLRTGGMLRTLSGHSAYVNTVAISPDGQLLVSGSDDKTIKLWDLRTGRLLRTLSGHTSNVNSVAFNNDGKILVSGSADKTIKVWRL